MTDQTQQARLYGEPWPPFTRDPLQGRPGPSPDLPPVPRTGPGHRKVRPRRRWALWAYLAFQLLVLTWILVNAVSGGGPRYQAVAWCHDHPGYLQCTRVFYAGTYGPPLIADAFLGLPFYLKWRRARR